MAEYILCDFNQDAGLSAKEFLTNAQVQAQQLVHILSTKKRTRAGRPDFGCFIEKFLFDPVDSQSAFHIKTEIRRAFTDVANEVTGVEMKTINVIPDAANQSHWVELSYTNVFDNSPEKLSFNLQKLTSGA